MNDPTDHDEAPPTFVYLVGRLNQGVKRELVERRVDPTHNRILQTRLTAKGRGMLRRAAPIAETLQDELLQDVPEHERDIVVRGLETAMRRLSSS